MKNYKLIYKMNKKKFISIMCCQMLSNVSVRTSYFLSLCLCEKCCFVPIKKFFAKNALKNGANKLKLQAKFRRT